MNSKLKLVALLIVAGWLAVDRPAHAQLIISGADGSDGELATPPRSASLFTRTVDLSQAVTGNWDDGNAANAGKGIYDPAKWAVVFKYSSVSIRTNTMVKFKDHPSRAPVVWLVSGDVIVDGVISVDGEYSKSLELAEGGPGGFRGGGGAQPNLSPGDGFGPGGGVAFNNGGTYQYGNNQIVPLIGGSGGQGLGGGTSGSAGGGAILIATTGRITINGVINANGPGTDARSFGGSGGAIRLIASELGGRGTLRAIGHGPGRIRIETPTYTGNLQVLPPTIPVLADSPPLIWPRATAPEARIISVAGKNAPADPLANLDLPSADINFQDDQPVSIIVETKNMDVAAASVNVRITPRNGVSRFVKAVFDSGTPAQARWIATTVIPQGFAALQVRAVGP